MKQKWSKWALRCAAAVLIGALTLSFSSNMDGFLARAGTAKERYEELEKELKELDSTIDKLGDQVDATKGQRSALQQQVGVLKEQIALLGQQIEEQQAAVAAKQQEIDSKKREMQATDALFRQRVRALYMVRNDGVLTTVLGANTYAEALTAADTLQRITQSDTDLLDTLQQQKTDLETEEAAQQAMLTELESNRTALDAKRGTLAGSLQQIDQTLSALDAQQAAAQEEYDRLYKQYQAAKVEAEKEFNQNTGHVPEYVGGTFTWPVPGYTTISSPYGWRELFGKQDLHVGLDITGTYSGQIYGAPVVAANDGYVTVARYGSTGYGICVYIDHGGGTMTRYGHCSSLAVSAGDYVTKGQVIAYAGNSGNSFGAHLHFEVRVNGQAVNPMQYFTQG